MAMFNRRNLTRPNHMYMYIAEDQVIYMVKISSKRFFHRFSLQRHWSDRGFLIIII